MGHCAGSHRSLPALHLLMVWKNQALACWLCGCWRMSKSYAERLVTSRPLGALLVLCWRPRGVLRSGCAGFV